jgi:hypothetical protein
MAEIPSLQLYIESSGPSILRYGIPASRVGEGRVGGLAAELLGQTAILDYAVTLGRTRDRMDPGVQIRARSPSLGTGVLVHAEHHGIVGRIYVRRHDLQQFLSKLRIRTKVRNR